MRTIYVGFISGFWPDAEKYLPEIKAPRNYTDPVKIAGYIENARTRALLEASEEPLTAEFADMYMIEPGSPKDVSAWPQRTALRTLGGYDCIAVINAQLFLSLAVAEQILKCGALTSRDYWALRHPVTWEAYLSPGNTKVIIDPIRAIMGTSAKDQTDPFNVAKRFNIPTEMNTAHQRAIMASNLCRKLGL
jgi:hypothetical protein